MQSILDSEFLVRLFVVAKCNLEKDGRLYPVLFVVSRDGRLGTMLLHFPKDSSEKRAYMSKLGEHLRKEAGEIMEAVMLVEGWFVDARTAPSALKYPPSQHPAREEALTLFGRNARGTRSSSVVQLFSRGEGNRPVWGRIVNEAYNEPTSSDHWADSLLDCLFRDFERR